MKYGMTMKQTMPGTEAAMNQSIQVISMPRMRLASSTAIGLPTMAVRNMAEMTRSSWKTLVVRKAPILRGLFSGSEPKASARLCTIGKIRPPARAEFEGMAGAMIISEKLMEYASFRLLSPKARMAM